MFTPVVMGRIPDNKIILSSLSLSLVVSVSLSVCLSVCLSVRPSVYLSVRLSVGLFIYLPNSCIEEYLHQQTHGISSFL